MYNLKAAVSRLDFAPETESMEVTDIATGHFVFSPLSGRQVSYGDLDKVITGAGYEIEKASIEVIGKLVTNMQLRVEETDQTFHLVNEEELSRLREQVSSDLPVTVSGQWKTERGIDTIVIQKWSTGSS
ncbi:MAG TPA: hypothetical protein DCY13_16145 [Verrucomicrobiales bacterium]|nr:hypothetical protein [Verrucomicrobiales bacterium]